MPPALNGRYQNTLKAVRDVTAKRDKKKTKDFSPLHSLRIYVIFENIFSSDTLQKCNSTGNLSLTKLLGRQVYLAPYLQNS
jgi:hypothetical protein